MKFCDEINEIMGNKPSVNPPVVIDTLDSFTETVSLDEESQKIEESDKGLSDENDADEDDNVKVSIIAAKGKESSGIKGKKRKRNKGEEVL